MSWILIGCAALVALLLVAVLARRPAIAGIVGGLLCGPVLYFAIGIHLARARGVGRFYSIPFSGDRTGDPDILASLAVWSIAAGLVVAWATMARRARTARTA